MKKFLLVAISIILLTGCGNKVFKEQSSKDAINFKNEYESLNYEVDENGALRYSEMDIDKVNKVVYLTYDELVDFIDKGTGVLYIGRPACPWCRLLIPTLLDFAKKENQYIYYYNIEKDRDENNDKYKNILSLLEEYLPIDTVTQNEADENFDPKKKRVVLPHVFFIKNGKVKEELMAYRHEFLENNDEDKMLDLLNSKYKKMK